MVAFELAVLSEICNNWSAYRFITESCFVRSN